MYISDCIECEFEALRIGSNRSDDSPCMFLLPNIFIYEICRQRVLAVNRDWVNFFFFAIKEATEITQRLGE